MSNEAMEVKKPDHVEGPDVAYLCKGQGAACHMAPSCVYHEGPVAYPEKICRHIICRHTIVPENAKYGTCDDPENHPERFEFHDQLVWRNEAYHDGCYWEVEKYEQC